MAAANTILKVRPRANAQLPTNVLPVCADRLNPRRTQVAPTKTTSRTSMRLPFLATHLDRTSCLTLIFFPQNLFTTSSPSSLLVTSHASPLPAECLPNMARATFSGLTSSTPTYHSPSPPRAHLHLSAVSTSLTSHTGSSPNIRYGSRTTTAQATSSWPVTIIAGA